MTAAISFVATAAHAAIVDDFEDGLDPNWNLVTESSNGINVAGTSAADALNGAQGLGGSFNTWMFQSGTGTEINTGDRLSALIRTASDGTPGRVYLGFGADATGTNSFVAASNTNDIRFQNNEGYGFSTQVEQDFSFGIGQTYLMTIDFLESGVIGSLFTETGNVLLGALEATGLTRSNFDGVALRTFGGFSVDDVTISAGFNSIPAVPLPPALSLGITGVIGLIMLGRRRKKIA